MAIKAKSVTSDSREKERSATRERVRRYRERKRKGITVTDNGFSLEEIEATVTLPPAEGVLTKEPLTVRTMFIGGRWLKILS